MARKSIDQFLFTTEATWSVDDCFTEEGRDESSKRWLEDAEAIWSADDYFNQEGGDESSETWLEDLATQLISVGSKYSADL